jgi:hypothetical protein
VSDEPPAPPPNPEPDTPNAESEPWNLDPDSVAVTLGGSLCEIPEGYVAFKGFLAGPDDCGMHRIYLDNSFWRWLQVRAADIKFREDVPANDRDPRSVFFLPREARVVMCRVDEAHEIEQEVLRQRDDSAAYTHPPW